MPRVERNFRSGMWPPLIWDPAARRGNTNGRMGLRRVVLLRECCKISEQTDIVTPSKDNVRRSVNRKLSGPRLGLHGILLTNLRDIQRKQKKKAEGLSETELLNTCEAQTKAHERKRRKVFFKQHFFSPRPHGVERADWQMPVFLLAASHFAKLASGVLFCLRHCLGRPSHYKQ